MTDAEWDAITASIRKSSAAWRELGEACAKLRPVLRRFVYGNEEAPCGTRGIAASGGRERLLPGSCGGAEEQ